DGEPVGRARRRLQVLREARDELSAVREIEVVRACCERRARHAVVLRLEGAGAVDHQVRSEALERRGEIGSGMVEARVLHREIPDGARLVGVAAGRDDVHAGGGDTATHSRTEVAVPSDHDNAHTSPYPFRSDYVIGIPWLLCLW